MSLPGWSKDIRRELFHFHCALQEFALNQAVKAQKIRFLTFENQNYLNNTLEIILNLT